MRQILNLINLKWMIEPELQSIKTFLVKFTLKIDEEKYLLSIVLRTNPWNYKIKDLNREKIIESFYKKELLLSTL